MQSDSTSQHNLRSCSCCGLAQLIPDVPPNMRASCVRCDSTLRKTKSNLRSNARTTAIALAAMILYPLAITLPMLRIEQFGHLTETSIINGVIELLAKGHLFTGIIVLLCSIILPLGKLICLLILSSGAIAMQHKHRAITYRLVEWTGRWGMLDVLLVAILVAALKIGDIMEVSPGPAAWAFTACVLLSLLATTTFDPHSLWEIPADNEIAPIPLNVDNMAQKPRDNS